MNNYPNYNNIYAQNSTYQNYNYNKCNYNQEKLDSLFDSYAGFIRGNMFPDLYNAYKLDKPFEIKPMNKQAELLTYIDALSFAALDLNLYLDNFPENKEMIDLFNQYRLEANKMIEEYENKYGPLFTSSNASLAYPWVWDTCPWPWENK